MNPIGYLYYRAKFQSDDVGVQGPANNLTWRQLLAAVRGTANQMRQVGLLPGQLVVTCLSDPQLDWIVTLALMHEAIASCATFGQLPPELAADFALSTVQLPQVPSDRTLLIDAEWLKNLPPAPENFKPRPFIGGSPFRLILTSGTTGQAKAAEFSLDTFLDRCERMSAPSNAFGTEVCMMGLSTVSGYTLAMRKMMRGVPFHYAHSAASTIEVINAYHVECLSGSPQQLTALLSEMQRTSKRLPSLKLIWYAGGEASSALLNNVRRDLCSTVVCLYGSTEVGGVCCYQIHDPNFSAGMAGYPVPEAEVEIVDDRHQPVGVGEQGAIRVKASGMALRYYNNPQETARSFRDGWFYPGDRGRLLRNGMLQLTGREHDLINRGGVKIFPEEIDAILQNYVGIIDVASFGFENHLGLEDICTAVVVASDFAMESFQRDLAGIVPMHHRPSLIIKLDEIPRNDMGKPLRAQLREQHGEKLRQWGLKATN